MVSALKNEVWLGASWACRLNIFFTHLIQRGWQMGVIQIPITSVCEMNNKHKQRDERRVFGIAGGTPL
jgi:hypothetical protein